MEFPGRQPNCGQTKLTPLVMRNTKMNAITETVIC